MIEYTSGVSRHFPLIDSTTSIFWPYQVERLNKKMHLSWHENGGFQSGKHKGKRRNVYLKAKS